jgi:ATP-binding cassette subfamily B protein
MASVVAASTVGGIAESLALLLAVRVALALTSGDDASTDLPFVGASLGSTAAIVLAACCAVVALLSHIVIAHLTANVTSTVLANVRDTATQRYVQAGWSTQALQRDGALQETVTTLASQTAYLAQSFVGGAAQLISLLMFILTAFAVDPLITLVVVAAGVGIVVFLRPVNRRNDRAQRAFIVTNSQYAEDVTRLTSTSMELRVFGVQEKAREEVNAVNEQARARSQRARFWMSFAVGLYKDLAVLLLVGAVAALSLASTSEITAIGVVVTLMVRSLSSAQAVNGAYQASREGTANLDALRRRLLVLEEGAEQHGDQAIDAVRQIELRDVGYRYSDEVAALTDISLRLEHGEALGVIGPSGGGKSTLIQVLLRLRPPTDGIVLVNGVDYRDFDGGQWSRLVALVPQEPTLLEASVADNIRYYRTISPVDVEQAARDAHVYDDIMRLPKGFDTELGPRGGGLSGGQKQRVAIARALAGRPQLLVMDEPTSALDVESESKLNATITELKGRTTLVIVAHRMKTVESCDRLLVLEHGRVAQLDTRERLLQQSGFYRRIHELTQA